MINGVRDMHGLLPFPSHTLSQNRSDDEVRLRGGFPDMTRKELYFRWFPSGG